MSVDAQTIYLLIGTPTEFNAYWHERLRQSEGQCHFLLDLSEEPQMAVTLPEQVTCIPYQADLVTALLPFYPYLAGQALEIGTLSETNARASALMQTLPETLEALQYFKLRADYSEYATNAFLNLFDLTRPIIEFSEAYEGKTAVVLGAAPSLDQYLPWIRSHQDKLVIFAVARLAKRLDAEGICPDFWVASDPTDASLAHAEMLETFHDRSALIVQPYAAPQLLEKWGSETLYWGPKWPQLSKDFTQEQNVEVEGGTVANLAIVSALGMGCRQVYLAGLDFCFADSEQTHTHGSLEVGHANGYEGDDTLENYRGEFCATTPEFKSAVEALPQQLAVLTERYGLSPNYALWQLNPGAAKIQGVELSELNDASLPLEGKPPIQSVLQALRQTPDARRQALQKILAEAHRHQQRYREINRLCVKTLQDFKRTSESAMQLAAEAEAFRQKIARADKKLTKLTQTEAAFLQRFGFDFFAETIQWAQQLEQQPGDAVLIYRYFRALFDAYRQTMEQLIPLMQAVEEKGRFLLAELAAEGDFEQLARLWLEKDKPHRFLPWCQKEAQRMEKAEQSNPELYLELQRLLVAQQAEQLELAKHTFALLSRNLHKIQAISANDPR